MALQPQIVSLQRPVLKCLANNVFGGSLKGAAEANPNSSVGIATDYGLGGPGIESRRVQDFPHLSTPALGPTQPPIQQVPGLSRG